MNSGFLKLISEFRSIWKNNVSVIIRRSSWKQFSAVVKTKNNCKVELGSCVLKDLLPFLRCSGHYFIKARLSRPEKSTSQKLAMKTRTVPKGDAALFPRRGRANNGGCWSCVYRTCVVFFARISADRRHVTGTRGRSSRRGWSPKRGAGPRDAG